MSNALRALGKSGVIAAFFFVGSLPAAARAADLPDPVPALLARADAQGLDQEPAWRSLLHTRAGEANITDPHFLLSYPQFDPRRELHATLRLLYGGDPDGICRFPARYLWLHDRLDTPDLPMERCAELNELLARAPMERISLVFASDNLAQPASMMGHVFLRFTGQAKDGRPVSHAISFYTEFNSVNYLKVFFDSLVIGLPGIFSLTPYEETLDAYVDDEQRAVWEYDLRIDDFHRRLIQYHLVELKNARLTYFFQDYNCATAIDFILSLADPHVQQHVLWTTPRDVIKSAQRAGLIQGARIITPARWRVRSLGERLGGSAMKDIASAVRTGTIAERFDDATGDDDFLRLQAARAVNDYFLREKDITRDRWRDNAGHLDAARQKRFADKSLIANPGDDPLLSPGESQIGVFATRVSGEDYVGLAFLPVSHALEDDNRQNFSESELLLFRTALMVAPRTGAVKLDRLDLYSIRTLVPYDPVAGGISGRMRIAIEPQWDGDLQPHTAPTLSGALGLTVRPVADIDVFVLLGAGVARYQDHTHVQPDIESGAVVREVADMKTIISANRIYDQMALHGAVTDYTLHQSWFASRRFTWEAQADQLRRHGLETRTGRLAVKYLF